MTVLRWFRDYGELVAVAVVALFLAFVLGYAVHPDTGPTRHEVTVRRAPPMPVFDCQKDELMVWVDAPHTGECVNVEEYELRLHVAAGHMEG